MFDPFRREHPFWAGWFRLTEVIFSTAEDLVHSLDRAMSAATSQQGQAQQKIFMVERVSLLMPANQPRWQAVSANSFRLLGRALKPSAAIAAWR